MKRLTYILIPLFLCNACALSEHFVRGKGRELLDLNTFKLCKMAETASYGYTSQYPIKVGGAETDEGVLNERRFLNALRGPNGEAIQYELKESCCYYRLPHDPSKIGLLDRYEVNVLDRKYILYFATFEEEKVLFVPKGFTFIQKDEKNRGIAATDRSLAK